MTSIDTITLDVRDSGAATGRIDDMVLLLGVTDMTASKQFYVDGLTVARASAGSTSSSICRTARSSWHCTDGGRSPRSPAYPRTAPARTGWPSAPLPEASATGRLRVGGLVGARHTPDRARRRSRAGTHHAEPLAGAERHNLECWTGSGLRHGAARGRDRAGSGARLHPLA